MFRKVQASKGKFIKLLQLLQVFGHVLTGLAKLSQVQLSLDKLGQVGKSYQSRGGGHQSASNWDATLGREGGQVSAIPR